MTAITREWGRYEPPECSVTFVDRTSDRDEPKPGCILLHGRGGSGDSMAGYAVPGWDLITALTRRGAACMTLDAGGPQAWSSPASLDALTRGIEYLRVSQQVRAPVALIGFSMGALTALNWSLRHRELAGCVAGLFPLVDLADLYHRDVNGCAAEIVQAHGGRRGVRAHNPMVRASSFADIPVRLWWSTDDPVISPATVHRFAEVSGACTTSLGACGHSQVGFSVGEVGDWVMSMVGDRQGMLAGQL